MTQRVDTIETVVDVFNFAMDIQELYLKQGPFKQLSMSEMHVLEAVDKVSSPSMSAVANHLNVTLGTLTTAVKKIVEKGFLIKEKSTQDQRIYYLRLTDQGKEALKVLLTPDPKPKSYIASQPGTRSHTAWYTPWIP